MRSAVPYRLALLLILLLSTVSAQAQFITDHARALAARDTLLRMAQQLRERTGQTTRLFETNARGHSRRRVVVTGTVDPRLVAPSPGAPGLPPPRPPLVTWKHVTRYRRDGRVQERFLVRLNRDILLNERRLNGAVLWLSIPEQYSSVMGLAMRHRGFYLKSGYLVCDHNMYLLPQPLQ